MIEKITIRDCATYDNNGCSIENLKGINFIYGANGTGKTTISNYLKSNIEQEYSKCEVIWKNFEIDTLVYNKKFREENFSSGKINGIFTLGKATKEELDLIEEKTNKRAQILIEEKQKKKTLENQNEKFELLQGEFKEFLWSNLYKKNEENFKSALRGHINSKDNFKKKILEECSPTPQKVMVREELIEKTKVLFSENEPSVLTSIIEIPNEILLKIESDNIWQRTVIGKSDVQIAKLIHKLNIDDWINEGRKYIQEDDETCPFCQEKTITKSFIQQLESYFDETYLNDLEIIKENKGIYFANSENIIHLLEEIEKTQKQTPNSKLDIELFSPYSKTLSQMLKANQVKIDNKLKEPSRKVELESIQLQIEKINNLILKANQEIKKHNDIINNYQSEKNNLVNEVWKYLIESGRTEIQKFLKEEDGFKKGIENLKKQVLDKMAEYLHIDSEIKELSKNLTDIEPTINEINRLLKYYGFLNFQIVKAQEEGYYQIKREDGSLAHSTLSEGEVTFITFLYFLQLANGSLDKNTITNDRVLVIDDPISSLDSNILFVISTLVKRIIKDIKEEKGFIKQLILLTHNVYFHKEVSFIDSRQNKSKEVHYWILRKNGNISNIQSYDMQNPIQSSYSLLWEELKNESITSSISIQNIMRRIIENYFKILGRYGDDDLIEKFEQKEEREICKSLLSWINDGSHIIPDDLFIQMPTELIDIYKRVFRDIFTKTGQIAHYNMMMGIES